MKEVSRVNSDALATRYGAFSNDGDFFLKLDQGVSLIDLGTGKPRWSMEMRTRVPGMLALSSDGQRLAINDGFSNTIRLLDTATSKLVATLHEHSDVPGKAAFSPDGNWLISLSRDKVILWDGKSGELKRKFICRFPFLGFTAFSADSKCFVGVTTRNLLGLFDVTTGIASRGFAPSAIPSGVVSGSTSYIGACFSEDGKKLIWAIMRPIGRGNECETYIDCWDLTP